MGREVGVILLQTPPPPPPPTPAPCWVHHRGTGCLKKGPALSEQLLLLKSTSHSSISSAMCLPIHPIVELIKLHPSCFSSSSFSPPFPPLLSSYIKHQLCFYLSFQLLPTQSHLKHVFTLAHIKTHRLANCFL